MSRWSGVGDAVAALDALGVRIDGATAKGVQDGSLIVQRQARLNATVDPQVRTGALRRSITTDGPTPTGPHSFKARTYPTIVYGRIIELGGVITVKRAEWLTFQWAPGQWARKKSVTIHPHPYLAPALAESQAAFLAAIKSRWADAIGG